MIRHIILWKPYYPKKTNHESLNHTRNMKAYRRIEFLGMGSAGRESYLGRLIPIKKLADVSCTPECVSRTRMVNHST